jgi:hypothetical protein
VGDSPGQGADRLGPGQQLLDLDREHAPVGALEELAAVPLGQLPPAGGVGVRVHAVLGEALAARVEHAVVGDQCDHRPLRDQAEQGAGDRAGGLAAADHAHLDRPAGGEGLARRPEAAAVQDAGMAVGLPGYPDRRPRTGQDQPVAVERQRLTGRGSPCRQPPAAVFQVDAHDLGRDRLYPELFGHPAQVPVPGTMVGTGLAAVDPVGQAAWSIR